MVEVARKIEIILLHSKQQNLFEFGACFYLNKTSPKFSFKQKNFGRLSVFLKSVSLKFSTLEYG